MTVKWYFKPVAIIIAILAVGPFALPLVWYSPALKSWHKIAITILLIFLTIWIFMASAKLYQSFAKQMQDLKAMM